MQYKSLKIENFRGISSLEINDMKRINLLVGRNNCGKTSILEALFLLSGEANPNLILSIHTFRNLLLTADENLEYIFKDFHLSPSIHIEGTLEKGKRELDIKPDYTDINKIDAPKKEEGLISKKTNMTTVLTNTTSKIKRLVLNLKSPEGNFESSISLETGTMFPNLKEAFPCMFMFPKLTIAQIVQQVEKITVSKKLDPIISVMKKIEPRIIDIRIGSGGVIYVDMGIEKLIPINIIGDGIVKILSILSAITFLENGVLLIDEIENGLHYTAMLKLWEAIIKTTKDYKVQVIATTHSYECIESLSKVYTDIEKDGDDIRLHRIDKSDNIYKVFSSASDIIQAAIEKELEIR